MAKLNTCRTTRPVNNPYEIWVSFDGTWQWWVLKKYKGPESEAKDPCAVRSPYVPGHELGDVYVREIRQQAYKVTEQEKDEIIKAWQS